MRARNSIHWSILLSSLLVALAACSAAKNPQETAVAATHTPLIVPTDPPQANLPNPASAYCVQQGYQLEIRTATDGSQSGVCIFPDGSECDEWAYFRGECQMGKSSIPNTVEAIPTSAPIDPSYYQGWWTYTHAVYNFSIMLPEDWVVEETTTFDPLMNGHLLIFRPNYASGNEWVRMTFRRQGEDALLWPTGVGQGEFIQQETLEVAGQPARRMLLVCPTGEVTSIYYHGEDQVNIARDDLEFGFIFSAGDHCEPGLSLIGKGRLVGEMIVASLKIP